MARGNGTPLKIEEDNEMGRCSKIVTDSHLVVAETLTERCLSPQKLLCAVIFAVHPPKAAPVIVIVTIAPCNFTTDFRTPAIQICSHTKYWGGIERIKM